MQIISQDRRSAVIQCINTAQVEALRANFNFGSVDELFRVHLHVNNKAAHRRLEAFVTARRRVLEVRDPASPVQTARTLADKYINRDGSPVTSTDLYRPLVIRCKYCGETGRHRFTTLPVSAQTCDDCA